MNRGSTLMSLAPRFMASVTHLNEMGWFSAALDPMMRMQSALPTSIQWLVMAPLPSDSPRAATVAECQMRAQCSTLTSPRALHILTSR